MADTRTFEQIKESLRSQPKRWLVTGAAGFIGSNIVEELLNLGQSVTGLDDFSSGYKGNLEEAAKGKKGFTFIEGDIRDPETCQKACREIDYVLHHAAIGSVPKSLEKPALTDRVNVGGFVNMIEAAAKNNVKRFVYASSSSVYGEGSENPQREDDKISPLSPYAAGKYANEMYAATLGRHFGIETFGLRYFNIFGPRQDPLGAYAAVIPKWISALQEGKQVEIFGDGETVRDFCYVGDAVQACILAACNDLESNVFNIAGGKGITLNNLFDHLVELTNSSRKKPIYKDFRPCDIRVSLADISKAKSMLAFAPETVLVDGLKNTVNSFKDFTS